MRELNIIGAGLAGCEAAWQAAIRGVRVNLYEMRRNQIKTPAHHTDKLAELVCSNSFRNDNIDSAIGLLHAEMRQMDSLIMRAADATRVPAGGALAMDREAFADFVTKSISQHPNINLLAQEITQQQIEKFSEQSAWIIASGPLTSDSLSQYIMQLTGEDKLAFFDAIAPIIYKESVNFDIAWYQSRYDKTGTNGDGKDYINCPLNKSEYYQFVDDLLAGEKTEFKEWEKNTPYFNGCLPIEILAARGRDTLRFGPMKPVGLSNPHKEEKPYAVVQLRQDNKLATLYNIVGFQTKLKYGAQKAIFSRLPGLEQAEFARLGGLHRNTFINSPKLLNKNLQLINRPNIKFAGQITGVEGYVESAAIGLLAGIGSAFELAGNEVPEIPKETALGSLVNHLTEPANATSFQPMNINFGLFLPLEQAIKAKKERYKAFSNRAMYSLRAWQQQVNAGSKVRIET